VSLLKAHIFKKRSRGDREEVEIRLFNQDGSEYEGGGAGGGGASMALRVRSSMSELVESEAVLPYDVPFGDLFVLNKEGFEFDGGDMEIPAPPGVYLFHIQDSWTNKDAGANSGEARSMVYHKYPDPEDPGTFYFDDMILCEHRAPYSPYDGHKVAVGFATEENGVFVWQVQQSSQELGMGYSGLLSIVKL
jgi:hypothetical protein